MTSSSARVRWLSGLSCLLLLVLLFLANALLARASARIDLTEEGLYTLSDGSEAILGRLEDPVRVQVFWHGVPLRFDNTKRYVAALLEEMEKASDGKVKPQWVDMSEDAGVEQASELGLPELTFGVRQGSEIRQAQGYMSIVVEMGDAAPEVINELANITDQLEYRIVSAIFKGQRSAPPIIGLVQHVPFNPMGGGRQQGRFAYLEHELYLAFGSALRAYLTLDTPVPEDVDVLILADPRDLSEQQAFRFEQFLLRGGRAIVLLDPLDAASVVGRGADIVRSAASGLEDWLGHVGITVEKGCVVDFNENASCLYPFEQRDPMGRTLGVEWRRYAHWPKVLPEDTDPTNPVMRYLKPMAMYWPAGLSIDEAKQKAAGRKVSVLATTTSDGYRRTDVTNLRQAGLSPEGKVLEKVPLIALVEGPLTSYWADKADPTVPKPEPKPEAKDEKGDGKGAEEKGDAEKGDGKKADGAKGDGNEAAGSPDGDAPAPKDDATPPKEEPKGDEPKAPEEAPKEPAKDAPKESAKDAPKESAKDAPKESAKDAPKEPKKDAGDGGDGGEDDDDGKSDDGDASDDAKPPEGPARLKEGTVRFVVLGDADLVANSFNPQTFLTQVNGASGFSFVLNMADWMSGSDELMALRSRATNPRNLEQMDDSKRDLIKHVNLFLVPLLVLLAGMTVFIVRRT